MIRFAILIGCLIIQSALSEDCSNATDMELFKKHVLPILEREPKGFYGKIGVIGGSIEYSGAPYFAAISALKAGADLVYVITTESAAPTIKCYSPELIVYPYLNRTHFGKIADLITKMDVIIIGSGLGREEATMYLVYEIILYCKELSKPLVLDADALFVISEHVDIIQNYPKPGVILTPNREEAGRLILNLPSNTNDNTNNDWNNYWGEYVAILEKGEEDLFYSATFSYGWRLADGGSGRRAGGEGDILAGVLGTFFHWSIKSHVMCLDENTRDYTFPPQPYQLRQRIASNAAARFTRRCNLLAYSNYGRSMTASDMIEQIPDAFDIFDIKYDNKKRLKKILL